MTRRLWIIVVVCSKVARLAIWATYFNLRVYCGSPENWKKLLFLARRSSMSEALYVTGVSRGPSVVVVVVILYWQND